MNALFSKHGCLKHPDTFWNRFRFSMVIIVQTKAQFKPKIVISHKFCFFPKFIYLFLYTLPLFIIVNGFYISATLCSDIIPHKHTLQFFLKILLHYQSIGSCHTTIIFLIPQYYE